MVCGFTGHRPEKLPWGGNEQDERCLALKQCLIQTVQEQVKKGADTFLCGMARGCDFYFAEAVLKLKGEGLPVKLEAVLPCPEQASRWSQADIRRYEDILLECDAVYLLQDHYTDGCMLRRNRALIDRCDAIITVWDGTRGGTGAAVRYAKNKAVEIVSLWL